jgi:hypothetical protein
MITNKGEPNGCEGNEANSSPRDLKANTKLPMKSAETLFNIQLIERFKRFRMHDHDLCEISYGFLSTTVKFIKFAS